MSTSTPDASVSHLSDARYGFDMVVATTQASINLTLKTFLSDLQEPECIQCYLADDDDNPVPIDYEELKRRAKGSDPFSASIRDGDTPETNPDVKNLYDAGFLTGFKARIGLPPMSDPGMIPNVVELGSQASAVTYRLLCSEFTVVEMQVGRRGAKWVKASQETDSPWVFESDVDLRLVDVDGTQYHTLPPDVQRQIKHLDANMFSVQQLLFILDNAQLSSTQPVITGVDPSSQAYAILTRYFLNTYFQTQRAHGEPVLGCVIQQESAPDPGTLRATDLNFGTSPMVDASGNPIPSPADAQKDLTTLNYLMMTGGGQLPTAVPFTWNWVAPEQAADFHGTMAVSRTAYANSLKDQIARIAQPNCLVPSVKVSIDWRNEVHYDANVKSLSTLPSVTIPATGSTILRVDYASKKAKDSVGKTKHGDNYGEMVLKCSYTLTLDVVGNLMTLTQHEVIYLYLRKYQTEEEGNVVDRTLTDVYTLGVDAAGAFVGTGPVSSEDDQSKDLSTSRFQDFFTNLNDLIDGFTDWLRDFTSQHLQHVPLNDVKGFVFPGGGTFAYKDMSFSSNQDLYSHITYLAPMGAETRGAAPPKRLL